MIVKEQTLEKLRLAFFPRNFLIPSPTVTKINFRFFFGITYAYNAKLSQSQFSSALKIVLCISITLSTGQSLKRQATEIDLSYAMIL